MKASFKAMWLLASLGILMLVAVGCNDTLRQFIVPVPSPSGDPGTLAHAIILSTNPLPAGGVGSDMHIDVSGDSSVGIVPLGLNPIFLGKTSNRVFIINRGDPTAATPIPPSVSTYVALLPTTTVSTVTLPATSLGPVAGATNSAGNFYIVNRLSNTVDMISGSVLADVATIQLPAADSNPVMIAGNASNNKVFVVNQNAGAGTVTEISTIDNTVIKDIPVGSNPIWAVMSTDGLFVFVVNQGDGTVSVIDTSLDIILPCAVSPSCPTGTAIKVGTTGASSPNFAFYDSKLKRVYVSNTGAGENTISVIQANGLDLGSNPQVLPTKLADIHLSGSPTSLTALSDGSRVYAALGNCPAGVNHLTLPASTSSCPGSLVSVIDAVGLRETGTIAVGPGAISVDASSDASRVYVVSANDITTIHDNVHPSAPLPDRNFSTPSISIIKTATNSVLATPVDQSVINRPLPTFHVPQQDPSCVPTIDPNFNSHVPMPCPLQTPFVVRTFP
ncbi:MAG TPA: YncE family protein [Candidatus Angelobacter sp.]|nr:YncE family protein [Candidatus Angelobacter sp.]